MEMIKLSSIKPNPNNPRIITAAQLQRLKNSIEKFELMLEFRPIVIDEKRIVLGGNQRLLALKSMGKVEIPQTWVKEAKNLSETQKKHFIIADNLNAGQFDFDMLRIEWDNDFLDNLGLELPPMELKLDEPKPEKQTPPENKSTFLTCPNCGCEIDIIE